MGRSTVYTPELGREAERLLSRGCSLRQAADEVGVSRRTLGRWVEQGRVALPQTALVEDVIEGEGVDDASTLVRLRQAEGALAASVLRAAQTDWRASAWLLERLNPEDWRLTEKRSASPDRSSAATGFWAELDEVAAQRRRRGS